MRRGRSVASAGIHVRWARVFGTYPRSWTRRRRARTCCGFVRLRHPKRARNGDAAVALPTCQLDHDSLALGLGLVAVGTGDQVFGVHVFVVFLRDNELSRATRSLRAAMGNKQATPSKTAAADVGDVADAVRKVTLADPPKADPERRGLESYRHRRLGVGVGGASRGGSRPVRTRADARG